MWIVDQNKEEQMKTKKVTPEQEEARIYGYCVELAKLRKAGTLDPKIERKLNKLNFPWRKYGTN